MVFTNLPRAALGAVTKKLKKKPNETQIDLPPVEQQQPEQKPEGYGKPIQVTQPEAIRDEETGKVTGVRLPNGKTMVGVGTKEAKAQAENYTEKRTLPTGAIEATAGGQARQQQIQLRALEQQQAGSNAQFNAQVEAANQPELTSSQRATASGISAAGAIAARLGLQQPVRANTPEELNAIPFTTKVTLQALGTLTGTSFAGLSLSKLFDTSGTLKNQKEDVSKNVAAARFITSQATSKGANIQDALHSLRQLEEGTNAKYNAAIISLRTSPAEIKNGEDLSEDINLNLGKIRAYKQSLERYAITGQKDLTLVSLEFEDMMEQQQNI